MCGKHSLLRKIKVNPDGAAIPVAGNYYSLLSMYYYAAAITLVLKHG